MTYGYILTFIIYLEFLCTFYWCFVFVFVFFLFSLSTSLCCGLSSRGITSYTLTHTHTRARRDVHTFLPLCHCLHFRICFILFAIHYSFVFAFLGVILLHSHIVIISSIYYLLQIIQFVVTNLTSVVFFSTTRLIWHACVPLTDYFSLYKYSIYALIKCVELETSISCFHHHSFLPFNFRILYCLASLSIYLKIVTIDLFSFIHLFNNVFFNIKILI